MRFCLSCLAVVVLFTVGAAHADTINTFTLNAELQYGVVTGTVTLNQTTGAFTDANLLAGYGSMTSNFTGTPMSFTQGSSYDTAVFAGSLADSTFSLFLPVASLKDYKGGALCSTSAPCDGNVASAFNTTMGSSYITSGSLVAGNSVTSVTPEPSSLLLLATGVLASTAVLRRRFS